MSFRDENGEAVVVIETKKRGGKLSKKDKRPASFYLELPSIRSFTRKHIAFIVDAHDAARIVSDLGTGVPVLTWQLVGALQLRAIGDLSVPNNTKVILRQSVKAHYAHFGIRIDPDGVIPSVALAQFDGSQHRYNAIRARGLPNGIENFLIGSEVCFCARKGSMPEPPHEWLRDEPSIVDVFKHYQQGHPIQVTSDREAPCWRLNWRPPVLTGYGQVRPGQTNLT